MSELDKIAKTKEHTEKIICPECGSVENATVKHTAPWWLYAHNCSKCGYCITESEWRSLKNLKKISFDNNYPKLHNQTAAELLLVINDVSGAMLNTVCERVTKYDTLRGDGKYYHIENDQVFMILVFLGDKGIPFTSIRKMNQENIDKYCDSVGEVFLIDVKEG